MFEISGVNQISTCPTILRISFQLLFSVKNTLAKLKKMVLLSAQTLKSVSDMI